jgi:UDP-glucuronate 4-epimerase
MSESGTIIVTGAAGFIGSHVCERLLSMGRRVVGVDNFDSFYDVALKRANVDQVRRSGQRTGLSFELAELDLAESAAVRELFERVKPEGVIHLAAKAGVRPSIAAPAAYARANVVATAVVLEESRRAGAARVVVASSSSVYGNGSRVPFSEEDPVNEPVSPYAASKRANELQCFTHWHLTNMPTACLRFFTVYGPRQRPDLAISTFLGKISRREDISVFGDGSSSRDYTYIDDIVSGVVASYERIDQHGYRVWNLGGSAPVRLDEMLATISRVVGHEPKITRLPMQPGDVLRTWADLSRSTRDLGYAPTTAFEDGVRKQWEWMNRRP